MNDARHYIWTNGKWVKRGRGPTTPTKSGFDTCYEEYSQPVRWEREDSTIKASSTVDVPTRFVEVHS